MGQLVFQATLGGQVNLVGPNTASTFNINVPATSGNMVTTGDTGTVTATMLASTTGSGAVVLATSPTLVTPALGTPSALVGTNITGTAAGLSIGGNAATATTATNVSGGTSSVTSETISGNLTLSGGTANGVAYLNGSKVVTTGSALTFDGTTLAALSGGTTVIVSKGSTSNQAFISAAGNAGVVGTSSFDMIQDGTGIAYLYQRANQPMVFGVNNSEQMRLTSTGLGIGTSSPATKLDILGTTPFVRLQENTTGYLGFRGQNTSGNFYFGIDSSTGGFYGSAYARALYSDGAYPMVFYTNATERMRLDSSGNLGLGVTPSAWAAPYGSGVFELSGAYIAGNAANAQVRFGQNHYYNGSSYVYKANGYATALLQNAGTFQFYNAPSGTAGNAITFTQAMTLDASGNLLVGTTSTTANGNFTNAKTSAVVSTNSNAKQWSITNNIAASNNATVDALLLRDATGTVVGTNGLAGHFYVFVKDSSGANAFSGIYAVTGTGNGNSNVSIVTVTTVTRGTSPVLSVQTAADTGGALKLTITYINNATYTNGSSCVSFVGVLN